MPGYAVRVPTFGAVAEPLWRALALASEPASIAELHIASRAHPRSITTRIERWERAGLIVRIPGRPNRFAMSDTTERTLTPPTVNFRGEVKSSRTVRDRLWGAMRVLKSFDLPTIMITAHASRRSSEDFINCLARAGYLRKSARGNGDWSRYTLTRSTGRLTPSIQHRKVDGRRLRELVDPNTGSRVDISPGAIRLAGTAAPSRNGGEG